MTKILFICHGNICRSVMAEFVMKELCRQAGVSKQFEIASAAVSTEEIGKTSTRLPSANCARKVFSLSSTRHGR